MSHVETAAVEGNRVDEVLLVAKSADHVLYPLNLGAGRFAGRVRNPVSHRHLESGFPAIFGSITIEVGTPHRVSIVLGRQHGRG